MKWRLTCAFSFEAAHSLPHLGPSHRCAKIHGHGFKVEVTVEVEKLDDRGFAGMDYAEFKPLKEYIYNNLDHQNLNDIMEFPTSEFLAQFLWLKAVDLLPLSPVSVKVSESDGKWCEFTP